MAIEMSCFVLNSCKWFLTKVGDTNLFWGSVSQIRLRGVSQSKAVILLLTLVLVCYGYGWTQVCLVE